MNLSTQDVGKEGTTQQCSFSNSTCTAFSFNKQILKDQTIVLKEIEEELRETTTAEELKHVTNEIIGSNVQQMDESEEFVARHLEKLEKELTKISGSIRSAYDLALKMDSTFVTNKKFRIMFLRADEFDSKKSARRMILHFKYKLDLFGEEKLVKEITFDDLNPTDQACLYTGFIQLSGVKDKWGRTVGFHFWELEKIVSWEHSTRAQWYQSMVLLQQDELIQKLGVILVGVGSFPSGSLPILLRRFPILSQALPVRIAAFHKCLINEKINSSTTTIFRAISSKARRRLRFHFEVISCLYNLFLYGIDPASVPLDDDGQPQTEAFFKVLEKQKLRERQQQKQQQLRPKCDHITNDVADQGAVEERTNRTTGCALEGFDSDATSIAETINTVTTSTTTTTTTATAIAPKRNFVIPTKLDVILGKGLKNISYEGNAILDKMVEREVISYKKATSQFEKSCIVLLTIKRMESIGGRFLKFCEDRYSEEKFRCILASEESIRDSIGTRFRYKARKIKLF